MEDTPRQIFEEYGINEVIESYVMNAESMDLINDYIFALINKVSSLQEENKQMKLKLDNIREFYPELFL